MFSQTNDKDSLALIAIIIKIANGGAIKAALIDLVNTGLSKCPVSIRYLRQAKFTVNRQ
jgi:hypothetical protein